MLKQTPEMTAQQIHTQYSGESVIVEITRTEPVQVEESIAPRSDEKELKIYANPIAGRVLGHGTFEEAYRQAEEVRRTRLPMFNEPSPMLIHARQGRERFL